MRWLQLFEQADDLLVIALCGIVEGAFATAVAQGFIRAVFEQHLHHIGVTGEGRLHQGSTAVVVAVVDLGLVLEQQLNGMCMAASGGPEQGGGAIVADRCDIGAAVDEELDQVHVTVLGRNH